MGATIDVDIGGTFTDCFVVWDGRYGKGKSPTTHYQASIGFKNAITAAAESFGVGLADLLVDTEVIRYSTTIATNTLIEKTGPRLGLITTAGFEDTMLIGRGRQWADGLPTAEVRNQARAEKPEPLIPREMIVGVHERVDFEGEVVAPIDREEVREKLAYLVNKGAMGFVVSFIWSCMNPVHEQVVRDVIMEEYPDTYLGSMPIILSSDVSRKRGEYLRTMTTVLDAYLHRDLSEQLTSLNEELIDAGYEKPLMIIHGTGGMSRLSHTAAVDTYNSGPVAGLLGGAEIAKMYGVENVLVTDVGGTSFDFGVVVDGEASFYDLFPTIERWRVQTPLLEVKTIGAGGGSIARISPTGSRITVGPESAGSMPGPACYGLGGKEPTVTDADLVLGYLNPEYYLGGKKKLDTRRARRAIEDRIAKPLGMSVEEAALAIKRVVDSTMGGEIFKEVVLKGYDPREFVMLAYGGAGATHCCGYAEALDVSRILTFPYSSVFCAFGGSVMDILSVYESSDSFIFYDNLTGSYFDEYDRFNLIVNDMVFLAFRDLKSQGFDIDLADFSLELEMRYGTQFFTENVASPVGMLHGTEDVKAICDRFTEKYKVLYGETSAYPDGGIEVLSMRLKATYPLGHYRFPVHSPDGSDPAGALKGTRSVVWDESGPVSTPIYDAALLGCGAVVGGPAIVEADDTTCVVPGGWSYAVDRFLDGVIEKTK
ncbi:MAG: hydantoinase/oxoprolinase family protein [Actinobacteria bacterium]|nr:hydantoinase/oxoprolinase family protein [Actinomycetota bacterium]MBU2688538.1 hydantoinase/oxoprolinase family protein [Actinomycetota bacterium]